MNSSTKIFILIGFALTTFSFAQVRAQEFSIGPKLGISQSDIQVNGTDFSTGSSRLGYHLGLFARLGGNRIFLQPEVLYTNTGGQIQKTQNNNQVNYDVTFNRIDTPIIFGFKLANFFRIQAGPAFSFLIDSDVDSDSPNSIHPDYKRSTLGYQAGIGIDIANMILDFKYEGALGKQAESIAGFATDQRQNQLILSLGIRLF